MSTLDHAVLTHSGTMRENNEDFYGFHLVSPFDHLQAKGHLFVVADGVGGYNAGEVASAAAVNRVLTHYYDPAASGRVERALEEALLAANLHVYDLAHSDPRYARMQTTLTSLVLAERTAYIAHVGDTRAYLVRNGGIRQLTGDHSEVAEMVRLRIISPEQARKHPKRNVITRSVGSDLFLRPDFARHPLLADDTFVLCTDGLWEVVSDEEMAVAVQSMSAEDACTALVDLALRRETSDNLTVQVICVRDLVATSPADEPARRRSAFGLPWRIGSRP